MVVRMIKIFILCVVCCRRLNNAYATGVSIFNSSYSPHCDTVQSSIYMCNYIPKDIPEGVTTVRIQDFASNPTEVTPDNFESEGWTYVTRLEMIDHYDVENGLNFTAKCFHKLRSLEMLKIEIQQTLYLHPDVFLDLEKVKLLDVSVCARLDVKYLSQALNTPDKLPSLEILNMSKVNYAEGSFDLDYNFSSGLNKKHLKIVDVTNVRIDYIYPLALSYLQALEVLNLSYSRISNVYNNWPDVGDLHRLEVLDLALAVLPSPFNSLHLINVHIDLKGPIEKNLLFLFGPRIVNVTGVLPKLSQNVWMENCKLELHQDLEFFVENVVARKNNLNYLDVKVDCNNFTGNSLIRVDISENSMQFIHPSISLCLPNLRYVDASGNDFHYMASLHAELFEEIFIGLQNLQEINLSSNGLENLPPKLFASNRNLEVIDFSFNRITQITLDLHLVNKLRLFRLNNNKIKIIDAGSQKNLMNIPTVCKKRCDRSNMTVTIYNNPFSCSECNDKSSLQWLLSTDIVEKKQNLFCAEENGKSVDITDAKLKHVEFLCQRRVIIVSSIVSVGTFCLLLTITVTLVLLRRRRVLKKRNKENVIRLLLQGQNQYKFAAFLSYSSLDEDFVSSYIITKLDEKLREITRVERPLLCIDDLNLRPGYFVLDETVRCMENSAIVIIVASQNFCQSAYCCSELNQAHDLKKPILLILKGKLEENLMTPIMQTHFRQNVRVLFEETNGNYILKNTWEHICQSVIDLIANQL